MICVSAILVIQMEIQEINRRCQIVGDETNRRHCLKGVCRLKAAMGTAARF